MVKDEIIGCILILSLNLAMFIYFYLELFC